MGKDQTPREAWAKAFLALLEDGPWLGDTPRPTGQDGLVKAFAARMHGRDNSPAEPEKAVRTWLNGTAPFSKAFDLICLVAWGPSPEQNPCYPALHGTWEAARKSGKAKLLDTAQPARRSAHARSPESLSDLAWTTPHAWQTEGLAVLFVDQPLFQNERNSYRLRVAVSFGCDQFTIDRRTFIARVTDAWLEPKYRNCHPVPDSAPGAVEPHEHIVVAGGRYQFRGPKPDGPFLYGNPFGTTPFAEIAWDHPGNNNVELTLSSFRTALDVESAPGTKPVSINKQRLIQHYLRVRQPKSESGRIDWARATVQGRARE